MHKTDRSEHARPAVGPRLDGRVRALREGEVMGAYMDFDRTADRAWTPAEYLVRFGEYVSQRTAEVNNGERPAWRFVGLAGCKPYLTQRQYEAQTPGMQQWYEPLPAAGDERSNEELWLIAKRSEGMDFLTQPIGADTSRTPKHVDEWLDDVSFPEDPGEVYARWWLDQARYPAWKKSLYAPLMRDFKLFCTYKGARFRCTGASRMGDVWLAADHERTTGYDWRVNVEDCTQWSSEP